MPTIEPINCNGATRRREEFSESSFLRLTAGRKDYFLRVNEYKRQLFSRSRHLPPPPASFPPPFFFFSFSFPLASTRQTRLLQIAVTNDESPRRLDHARNRESNRNFVDTLKTREQQPSGPMETPPLVSYVTYLRVRRLSVLGFIDEGNTEEAACKPESREKEWVGRRLPIMTNHAWSRLRYEMAFIFLFFFFSPLRFVKYLESLLGIRGKTKVKLVEHIHRYWHF